MRLSKQFVDSVKIHTLRNYEIASFAGVHHTMLSKWLHGVESVKPDDPRVLRIAKLLGLKKNQIFAEEE